jgi:succinate dehydrogenase / fumarate reductase, cytochrome b subunit
MSAAPAKTPRPRPQYYDLNLLHLPAPGLLSIFHRISGAALILVIPVLLFIFQEALASEAGFAKWKGMFATPVCKLIILGFVWCYMHHFFAGIRYLLLDIHLGVMKEPSQLSAKIVIVLGVLATIAVGVCIW